MKWLRIQYSRWRNRLSYFDKIRLFNFDINDRFIEYKNWI